MRPREVALRELVSQWLGKADADFEAAEQLAATAVRFREMPSFFGFR